MLDEFICDQKEKCSNDLSCIGCYPQEEKSKVVFEMGGEPIKMDNYDLDKKAEEEWSVRGYYNSKCGGGFGMDANYFKSFKTEEEARVFYNSITKTECDNGKILYKEPYEEQIVLEEEGSEHRWSDYF